MAAAIAVQSSPNGRPSAPATSFQKAHAHGSDNHLRHHAQVSSSTLPPSARGAGQDASSCDACLRRKSRCAMNEMVNKCYSCEFHRQDCTFTLSNRPSTGDMQSKKRKLDETLPEDAESATRYDRIYLPSPAAATIEPETDLWQTTPSYSGFPYKCFPGK